jgi:transposase-like protein
VLTEGTGQVGIEVSRDRDGTFEPQIVKKRQRRLNGVDEIILSLYAKGPTTGEISAHFAEIYGASVSKETVSRITDRVVQEMQARAARPLDEVYAAVLIDAIVVKVRDGQLANRSACAAIGVTLAGADTGAHEDTGVYEDANVLDDADVHRALESGRTWRAQ